MFKFNNSQDSVHALKWSTFISDEDRLLIPCLSGRKEENFIDNLREVDPGELLKLSSYFWRNIKYYLQFYSNFQDIYAIEQESFKVCNIDQNLGLSWEEVSNCIVSLIVNFPFVYYIICLYRCALIRLCYGRKLLNGLGFIYFFTIGPFWTLFQGSGLSNTRRFSTLWCQWRRSSYFWWMVSINSLILFINTIWIWNWKYMIQNILIVNDTILVLLQFIYINSLSWSRILTRGVDSFLYPGGWQ